MKIVTVLSHRLEPGGPVWPGDPETELQTLAASPDYSLNRLVVGEHTSTHLGAPSHYGQGDALESFPDSAILGRAAILRLDGEGTLGQGGQIDAAAIDRAFSHVDREETYGIDLALIVTGWAHRWGSSSYFHGDGEQAVPGLSIEGLERLIQLISPIVVGIDGPNIDYGGAARASTECGIILARNSMFHLENVAVVADQFRGVVDYLLSPIRISGATGAPCTFAIIH
jgi:kynurenine formamidase